MIIRATDANGDWTFGKGKNNYKSGQEAVMQNIDERLQCFLGDCFFDLTSGIDWFNLIGGKDVLALNLSVSRTIVTSRDVLQINQLSINLNRQTRAFSASYLVDSVYSTSQQTTQFTPATV